MVALRSWLACAACGRTVTAGYGAWWWLLPHLDCVAHAHTGDGRLLGRRQRRGEADEAVLCEHRGVEGDNLTVRLISCTRPRRQSLTSKRPRELAVELF